MILVPTIMDIFFRILSMLLMPLALFWRIDTQAKSRKKFPVILMAGWFSTDTQSFFLKKRLEAAGYKVYVPHFGLHLGHVSSLAEKLAQYIEKKKIGNCIFIGHSMAGLIGLYYYLNYSNKIRMFISYGTPYYGTDMARLAFWSGGARDMVPNSNFMGKLHSTKMPLKKFYSLATPHDSSVPVKTTKLKGAHHYEVNVPGHMALLFSKTMSNKILELLNA